MVQTWSFFQLYFLGNIGQENIFYDSLEGKNVFLGYKNKKFKKSKYWHFSNGVNAWFWSKDGHFFNFFILGNIGKENVFYDILGQKNAFLGYKKKSSKSQNIDIFQNRLTHAFGPKMAILPPLFLRQYRPGKCLLRYSRAKKRLSRLKKQEVQTFERLTFFQRG